MSEALLDLLRSLVILGLLVPVCAAGLLAAFLLGREESDE